MSWICWNCETENPDGLGICEVCGLPRATSHDDIIKQKYSSDTYKAVIRYRFSLLRDADGGDARSQYMLGDWFCCHKTNPDYKKEGAIWLSKAANQGDLDAQYQLAQCYETGYGINKDETIASVLYQKAAKQGHVKAQRSYLMLKYRTDVYDDVYNIVLGNNLRLMVSADEGDRESQYSLGRIFYPGRNIREEIAAALWLEKAAKQGHKDAQYFTAVCYEKGRGVSKNIGRSIEYYKKAALNGNDMAQLRLADYYLYGKTVKKDVREALKWYSMTGEELTDKDLLSIGICFEAGDGISVDKEKAVEYYRKSAEKGNTIAQYRLGLCYENGIGVGKNLYYAKTWYEKAADKDINASNRLTAIKEYEKKERKKEYLKGFLVIGSTVLTFFLGCNWFWNTPEDSWTHNTLFNIGWDNLTIGPWIVMAITLAVYKIMTSITNFDE